MAFAQYYISGSTEQAHERSAGTLKDKDCAKLLWAPPHITLTGTPFGTPRPWGKRINPQKYSSKGMLKNLSTLKDTGSRYLIL